MNNYQNIPQELMFLMKWVNWGVSADNPKCPYDPKNLSIAKVNKPGTWSSFEQAIERVHQAKALGIGFVFDGSGYIGVDLDIVRDPHTGEIVPYAIEIINECATYTEISPSGYGLHMILKCDIQIKRNKAKLPVNKIVRFDKDGKRKEPEIEIYSTGRYFTMTGDILTAI